MTALIESAQAILELEAVPAAAEARLLQSRGDKLGDADREILSPVIQLRALTPAVRGLSKKRCTNISIIEGKRGSPSGDARAARPDSPVIEAKAKAPAYDGPGAAAPADLAGVGAHSIDAKERGLRLLAEIAQADGSADVGAEAPESEPAVRLQRIRTDDMLLRI